MAKFKIAEAAKLVGIDRKTIYKHIKKGKVSATLDELDNKCIDAAELHRAYGNFEAPATVSDKLEQGAISEVVAELRLLRQEVKQLRQELAERPLLEHQPKTVIGSDSPAKPEPEPEKPPETSFKSIIQRLKEKQASESKN